jgi:hypothetical protein
MEEKLFNFADLPDHLRRSIIQDLKQDGKRKPQQVALGMKDDIVHYYRPIYVMHPATAKRRWGETGYTD